MTNSIYGKMKESLFMSFDQLRCYGVTSYTVLYLIFIVRIFTQLTAISYNSTISDPAFAYLKLIKDKTTIGSTFLESNQMRIVVISVFFVELLYFYCLATLKFNQNGIIKTIKMTIIKLTSFLVFILRIIITRVILSTIIVQHQRTNYFFLALLFLVLGFLIIITSMNEMFCTQITLVKSSKTLLSKSYHYFNPIGQFLLISGVIFGKFLFTNDQLYFLVGCHSILIIAFSLKLWVLVTRKKYYFSQAQNLQIFQCNLCIIFYFLAIIGDFVNLLQENLFLTMIVMSTFSQMAILAYKNSKSQMSLCNLNPSFQRGTPEYIVPQISLHQGQSLIYHISQLIKQYKGQKQYILLISLITEHLRTCENNECYHHEYQELNKKQMIENQTFRSKFLFSFVQNIFFYYSQHFQIWSLYQIYKLQIALNFPEIQFELEKYKLNRQKISFSEQFTIYQIQTILSKFIEDKNSSIKLIHVQKVILQQDKCKEIIQNIRQILIGAKQRFEALEQNIVNLNFVDSIISNVTKNIRKIQKLQIQSFRKYQYNIFTQELFLFYYNFIVHSLSQSNQISKIINNKLKYLKSLKGNTMANIQKFMYQKKCCVIQSNINPQKMGFISNITQNCLPFFGFKKKELINESINKILPKFLNQEHNKLLQSFLKTGNFSRFGQKIQSFSLKKGVCFNVLVNIQICTSYKNLKLYALVMKINDLPNVLMDQKYFIQGYDEKLKEMFNSTCINDYFLNFCLNLKLFKQNLALQGPQSFQFLILSIHNKEKIHQIKKLNLNINNYLQKIKQYLGQNFQRLQNSITVYLCQVQISRVKFGKIFFYDMKFNEINQIHISSQKVSQKTIIQNNLNTYLKTNIKKTLLESLKIIKNKQVKQIEKVEKFAEEQRDKNSFQSSSQQIIQFNNQQQKKQINKSVSSLMSTQGNYYFQKLFKTIKEKFLNKNKINFRELNIATCIILILVIIIIAFLIVEFIIFTNGLSDFQSVAIANQKVSYTLQLLELLYNKAMLMYQYCVILPTIPGRCQQITTSSVYMQNYLFQELSSQFDQLMTFKTMDGFYNYYYLMQPIIFNFGNGSHSIQTIDFIENCYYAILQISNWFQNMKTDSTYTHQMFTTFMDNWKMIKQLNTQGENLYIDKGSQILDTLKFQLVICQGLIMLICFLIVLIQRKLNNFMENKRQQIIRLNQNVPVSYLGQVKVYCEQILNKIHKRQFWQRDQDLQLPLLQQNSHNRPQSEFIYKKSKVQYLFFISFLVLMGLTVFYSFSSMTQVFPSFKNAQQKLNQFVKSERLVLQNFFDLKQMFLLNKFDPKNLTEFNKLYKQMFQVQVQYNKISLQLFNLFSDSQSYKDDIKYYLTENICNLSAPYLNSWQIQQCTVAYFSFYKYGVLPLMDYNERIAIFAALSLKKTPYTAPYVYASDTFYDIDRNPIYLIQIFKLIQDRINMQIQNYKQTQESKSLVATSLEVTMLFLVLLFWILNYRKVMEIYSDLYGHIIVFPLSILTKSKKISKVISENMELDHF